MWLDGLARSILSVDHRQLEAAKEILIGASRVFLIGNGGSAAIASHIATDFSKSWRIPATAFNDPAFLTCLANDYGYEEVFKRALQLYPMRCSDVLVAISSSGKSENILRGAREARALGGHVITLSGFAPDNPLRTLGHVNLYVPDGSYGIVEITHLAILHSMVRV